MDDKDNPSSVKPRTRVEIFEALVVDKRISHGAFRLFHVLRSFENFRTGACFPGRRTQAKKLGSNFHHLKKWTAELVASGWLSVAPSKRGEVYRYQLLDGLGQPWPKVATPGVARSGSTRHRGQKWQHSAARSGSGVLPEVATKHYSLLKQREETNSLTANANPALAEAGQDASGQSWRDATW